MARLRAGAGPDRRIKELEGDLRRLKTLFNARASLTKAEAAKIIMALHPDNAAGSETRHAAFIAFNQIKDAITRQ